MHNPRAAVFCYGCVALALLSGCGQPMGPVPGGKLSGETENWPQDWSFAEPVEEVFLEVDPADPYSVTLWGVGLTPYFYVAGTDADSGWVKKLLTSNEVVLSVSGRLFEGRASRVEDKNVMSQVLQAYGEKYDLDREDGEEFVEAGGIVFQITPR